MLVILILATLSFFFCSSNISAAACSNGQCKLRDNCSSDEDCEPGLYCFSGCSFSSSSSPSSSTSPSLSLSSICVRDSPTDPFKLPNNSLPFNKYAFLTTHNSFAIDGEPSHTGIPRLTITNQEDNITQQLRNGVRAFMLDTYDYQGQVWLCHSFGGQCHEYTAFEPAIDTLKEIEVFLSSNPTEIVTLILEDYVKTPRGLTKAFDSAGLRKYWFPLSHMPKNGRGDWPLVSEMIRNNHRLIVFTSIRSKQDSEAIAYQWNFMLENQYGGMKAGKCPNRAESSPMNDTSKSLLLVNHFRTIPLKGLACRENSATNLITMLRTCHDLSALRWPNFLAIDYYKRSDGGGAFEALDMLNGELQCGSTDLHACPHARAATTTVVGELRV